MTPSNRRSLSQAFEFTPAQHEFIHGNTEQKEHVRTLETARATLAEQPTKPSAATTLELRALPPLETLVPVTSRLHPRTAEALRRAHLEQKLNRRSPTTQQEIIEAAVANWLTQHGWLE